MALDKVYPSKPRLQLIIMHKQISYLVVLTILFKDGERKMKENSKSSRTNQGVKKNQERTHFQQPRERWISNSR